MSLDVMIDGLGSGVIDSSGVGCGDGEVLALGDGTGERPTGGVFVGLWLGVTVGSGSGSG